MAVTGRQFQFEWGEIKATNNVRKHGVSFELARTISETSPVVIQIRLISARTATQREIRYYQEGS